MAVYTGSGTEAIDVVTASGQDVAACSGSASFFTKSYDFSAQKITCRGATGPGSEEKSGVRPRALDGRLRVGGLPGTGAGSSVVDHSVEGMPKGGLR